MLKISLSSSEGRMRKTGSKPTVSQSRRPITKLPNKNSHSVLPSCSTTSRVFSTLPFHFLLAFNGTLSPSRNRSVGTVAAKQYGR